PEQRHGFRAAEPGDQDDRLQWPGRGQDQRRTGQDPVHRRKLPGLPEKSLPGRHGTFVAVSLTALSETSKNPPIRSTALPAWYTCCVNGDSGFLVGARKTPLPCRSAPARDSLRV